MKGKKPEVGQQLFNSVILDQMPGTSKTKALRDGMSLPNRSMGEREQSFLGERIERQQSWGIPAKDPVISEYLTDLERLYSLPGTIEDDIPPVSQAFADKVKAMGGIMTPAGLICDPTVPVVGKRYMRLARALFCTMFSNATRHVEDAEFHIRNYANRNRERVDWEGTNAYFAECLKLAFEHRHKPGRKPVYANKD